MQFSGFDSFDTTMWTPLASRQTDGAAAAPHINPGPLITGLTMLALSWTAIALRFYTRIRLVRNVGWDDITMAIAIVIQPHQVFDALKLTHLKALLLRLHWRRSQNQLLENGFPIYGSRRDHCYDKGDHNRSDLLRCHNYHGQNLLGNLPVTDHHQEVAETRRIHCHSLFDNVGHRDPVRRYLPVWIS